MKCFIVITALLCISTCQDIDPNNKKYLDLLFEKYGENGTISLTELETLIQNIRQSGEHNTHASEEGQPKVNVSSEAQKEDNQTCLGVPSIFSYHHIEHSSRINSSQFTSISPTIIYTLQDAEHCDIPEKHRKKHVSSPKEVWGYGFLCVTFINLCSLMGMFFIPLMKKKFYQKLLMFMVALAVGTLCGSSLLFLIPSCFGMDAEDSPYKHIYIWRLTTVIGGIYMFFLVERILQNIMGPHEHKHSTSTEKSENVQGDAKSVTNDEDLEPLSSVRLHTASNTEAGHMYFDTPKHLPQVHNPCTIPHTKSFHMEGDLNGDTEPRKAGDAASPEVGTAPEAQLISNGPNGMGNGINHNTNQEHKKPIRSVAWMVIFGDGIHNFIDGLSIGAAFSTSILTGISVSVAVICEELPHELGDFAILLNAGMSMKKALSYNFMSACMCYLGLILGIVVGEMTEGSVWIFALAGGMFLYISLVDMLPEVNHAAEEETKKGKNKWSIFMLQNCGLVCGFGIMLVLALFSENIDFERFRDGE